MTGSTGRRAAALLMALVLLSIASCLLHVLPAHAHTPKLSVLTLEERAQGQFIAHWERTQGIEDVGAAYDLLRPTFPEHCEFTPPLLDCGVQGLVGQVGFEGLADLSSSGTIQIRRLDGSAQMVSLTGSRPLIRLADHHHDTWTLRSLASFVRIGVTHIWLGLDHLAFVLGLLWLVDSWRVLIPTVTAFTIAHSLTLAAATLGLVTLPPAPIEAVIALSIAFVALELAREAHTRKPSPTRQRPWLVAFAFGLLHGFGFAGAMAEQQIAPAQLPVALLGFNLGVELGQLAFIAALLGLRPLLRWLERALGVPLAPIGHYALGSVAMYWFFERVAGFIPGV